MKESYAVLPAINFIEAPLNEITFCPHNFKLLRFIIADMGLNEKSDLDIKKAEFRLKQSILYN